MKKILSFILLSALTPAAFSVEAAAAEKPVVAQFAAYYSGKDARLPDPNLVTHIIFAPARINADFSLQIPAENMLDKVAALKAKNPDLKITLLIGGAKSANFSEAVSTKENRAKLLDSFESYINRYNLDGIDLDWEFPTKVDPKTNQNGKPEDVENYTLLMKDYRERFPAKILTVDVGNDPDHIDFAACEKYVDYFHLMSYDYSTRSHNAPLFGSNIKNNNYVEKSVDKLSKSVPAKKIVMGIPFYGRISSNKKVQIAYNAIAEYAKSKKLTLCRDEKARVPFYLGGNLKFALSFDDEISVREKCAFAKKKKLGGVMAWQFLNDDENLTLSKAAAEAMGIYTK